jgi:hypothetical protein
VVSGDGQTAVTSQTAQAPVVIEVSAGGRPIQGAPVAIVGPAGAAAVPSTGYTDSLGRFTTSIILGRRAETYAFTASSRGAFAGFSATAVAPPAGIIYTEVNPSHSSGIVTDPTPGTLAKTGNIFGVAVASDGTVYLSDRPNVMVLALSPEGIVTRVAGTGGSGETGDGGLAINATLTAPSSLAIDDSNAALYILEDSAYVNVVRKVDLGTGIITTFAGGGTQSGDGVPATAAALYGPAQLSVGPDHALYIGESGRIRRVDPVSQVITTFAGHASGSCPVGAPPDDLATASGGGSVVWDAIGNAFMSGQTCSGHFAIVRRSPGGTMTRVAGQNGGFQTDGSEGALSEIGYPTSLAIDPGGNLYFISGQTIRRIEGSTGRLTTIAGDGAIGGAGDWGPATQAELYYPAQIAFDGALNLHVADSFNWSARVVVAAGSSTPSSAELSVVAGDGQTVYVDELASSLRAMLQDEAGAPLYGYRVNWAVIDDGGALYASTSNTDLTGIAAVNARPGLQVGSYTFSASFEDIHGVPVTGSPAVFTIAASAPPAGTSFAVMNTGRSSGYAGFPGPGTLVQTGRLWGLAVASDGTVYVGDVDHCHVYRLTPAGYATVFAGNGTCGHAGDGGQATEAQIMYSRSIALDEARGRLYIADGYPGDRVRVVDLATNVISLFAGSGTAPGPGYGNGGPATSASLSGPGGLSVAPDGTVYIVDGFGYGSTIRKVDVATGVISAVLAPEWGWCSSGRPIEVVMNGNGGSGVTAVDSAGNLYFVAYACNAAPGASKVSIWRMTPAGALSLVAGTGSSYAEGIFATNALVDAPTQLALDGAGGLYFTDWVRHWVRRIDLSSGVIHTIAGKRDGTPGTSLDYLPASDTALNYSWGVAVSGNGHIFIADSDNVSLRIVW